MPTSVTVEEKSVTIHQVDAAKYAELQQKCAAQGLHVDGPTGETTMKGVKVGWKYDAAAQTVTLTVLHKPVIYPMGTVLHQISDLAMKC